jgi:hypothetical protein
MQEKVIPAPSKTSHATASLGLCEMFSASITQRMAVTVKMAL